MDSDKNVFINCPFDKEYFALLKPLVFSIVYIGFNPRISLESSDSGTLRLNKLLKLIKESKYSIHDLSRLQAKNSKEYYRLNMPFELGLDYSSKHFDENLIDKKFLIVETEKYDYMKAISDINGLDIKAHYDEPQTIIECVITWFTETVGLRKLGSPLKIWYEFMEFNSNLYEEKLTNYKTKHDLLHAEKFAKDEIEKLTIPEYIDEIRERY